MWSTLLGVLAQVTVDRDTSVPGGELIRQLLGWGQQVALWGSLAGLLGGAGLYAWGRQSGSFGHAHRGQTLALGGGVGAILAGLAPTIVNGLFNAAN